MRLDYKCVETKISARRTSRGKIDTKYHASQTDKKDGACTNQGLFFIYSLVCKFLLLK